MDEEHRPMSRRSHCLAPCLPDTAGIRDAALLHKFSQPKSVLQGHEEDPSSSLGRSVCLLFVAPCSLVPLGQQKLCDGCTQCEIGRRPLSLTWFSNAPAGLELPESSHRFARTGTSCRYRHNSPPGF